LERGWGWGDVGILISFMIDVTRWEMKMYGEEEVNAKGREGLKKKMNFCRT